MRRPPCPDGARTHSDSGTASAAPACAHDGRCYTGSHHVPHCPTRHGGGVHASYTKRAACPEPRRLTGTPPLAISSEHVQRVRSLRCMHRARRPSLGRWLSAICLSLPNPDSTGRIRWPGLRPWGRTGACRHFSYAVPHPLVQSSRLPHPVYYAGNRWWCRTGRSMSRYD